MPGRALHVKRAGTALVIAPIKAYRRWISPGLPPRCKYYPSCSRYAEEAITELGVFRGTILAVWRVLRCNPLSWGGVDELPDRKLFRATPLRSERRLEPAPIADREVKAA